MRQLNTTIQAALERVEGKGIPVLETGTTGSGKSTVISECFANPDVQDLHSMREACGKGSTAPVQITITDDPQIPEDTLIYSADLIPKTKADFGDDNEFLGGLLYAGCKDYAKRPNAEVFAQKVGLALKANLSNPSNESLAYKFSNFSEEKRGTLLQCVLQFPPEELLRIFDEAHARHPKKGQGVVRVFIELLNANPALSSQREAFWDVVMDMLNQDMHQLRDELVAAGASIEHQENGSCHFVALLGMEDFDSPIAAKLLKSEDVSQEYLLSNISLVGRGADFVFDIKNSDLLTVAEYQETSIHCLRLIDTQGLFHAVGVSAKEEAERIIDLLSTYHSDQLLLIMNAYVSDTVKNGYTAVCTMLQEANRDVAIYVMYTHWDEYLSNHQKTKLAGTGSRHRGRKTIDWDAEYAEALKKQEGMTARLRESIQMNDSKHKPSIIGVYHAALLTDAHSEMEGVLKAHQVTYNVAICRFIDRFLEQQATSSSRYRVQVGMESGTVFCLNGLPPKKIPALYNNLVGECKGKRLFASTVRACLRKWRNCGDIHKSYVLQPNANGFQNIETEFVREIRNYALSFLNPSCIQFHVKDYLLNQNECADFEADLIAYLKANQALGRQVARNIGDEAYEHGFQKQSGFAYQYDRFQDMLQYTQDTYFFASSIPLTTLFADQLQKALCQCIMDFVDMYCIVVY